MPDRSPSLNYYFVSYARQDWRRVAHIVQALQEKGFRLWVDVEQLKPGDDWMQAATQALQGAAGLIIFVSPASMDSRYVRDGLNVALQSDRPIVPVLLEELDWAAVPSELSNIQYVNFARQDLDSALQALVKALHRLDQAQTADRDARGTVVQVATKEDSAQLEMLAADQVEGLRRARVPQDVKNTVFIVHGHDHATRDMVRNFLDSLGVESIVLSEEENRGKTVFEKFWRFSVLADFAVVLLTPDDLGAAKREYYENYRGETVGDKALKFRARQNVILELGFFYGRLGTEHVFVLLKHANTFYPPFERPSDMDGLLFDEIDAEDKWKAVFKQRLIDAGFQIDD